MCAVSISDHVELAEDNANTTAAASDCGLFGKNFCPVPALHLRPARAPLAEALPVAPSLHYI